MAQIHPYIHFNGNTEEAFSFYQSIFGGNFSSVVRYKDLHTESDLLDHSESNKIMHIALPIGQCSMLLGSDVPNFLGVVNEKENRSKISIQADSKEEAFEIFNKLSVNGEVEVPFSESTLGVYFGMLRDKFGIEWMINFDSNK